MPPTGRQNTSGCAVRLAESAIIGSSSGQCTLGALSYVPSTRKGSALPEHRLSWREKNNKIAHQCHVTTTAKREFYEAKVVAAKHRLSGVRKKEDVV